MKRTIQVIAILVIIASGIGGVLSGAYPVLGTVLTMLGVFWSIYQQVSGDRRNLYLNQWIDAMNSLMANSGAGNPYTEMVKKEFRDKGFCKNAIATLKKALELNPNDEDALMYYVIIMSLRFSFMQFTKKIEYGTRNVEWKKIFELAARGFKINPQRHVFLDAMGILYDVAGFHAKARKMFLTSSKLRRDPYWHILLSTSYGMSGNLDLALKEVEDGLSKGAGGWFCEYNYANALYDVGRYDEAYIHVMKAIKMGGSLIHLLPIREKCLFLQARLLASACDKIRLSLILFSFNKSRSVIYFARGIGHFIVVLITSISRKIWPITRYVPLLNKFQYRFFNPCEVEYTIGNFLMEKNRYDLAIGVFEKCRQVCADDIHMLINLSGCYALNGDRSSAIKVIDEAIRLDPKNELLLHNREQFVSGAELKRIHIVDRKDGNVETKTVNKP